MEIGKSICELLNDSIDIIYNSVYRSTIGPVDSSIRNQLFNSVGELVRVPVTNIVSNSVKASLVSQVWLLVYDKQYGNR